MLLTEQNTKKVERLVIKAAAQEFGRGKGRPYFEHGQWWVIVTDSEGDEQIYSVVDSSPSIAGTGLSFEQVS